MACTNFPSTGLVANVTQHQVGNVTYLYKGGAPTAPLWEAITPPINLDQVHRRVTTVAAVEAGNYKEGAQLTLSDRAGADFDVVAGGTPNGFDVLDADNGNTAVLQGSTTALSAVGSASTAIARSPESVLDDDAAITTEITVDGEKHVTQHIDKTLTVAKNIPAITLQNSERALFDTIKVVGGASSTDTSSSMFVNTQTGSENVSNTVYRDLDLSNLTLGLNLTKTVNQKVFASSFKGMELIPLIDSGGYGVLLQGAEKTLIHGDTFTSGDNSRHAIYVSRLSTDPVNTGGSEDTIISDVIADWTSAPSDLSGRVPFVNRSPQRIVYSGIIANGGRGSFVLTTIDGNARDVVITGDILANAETVDTTFMASYSLGYAGAYTLARFVISAGITSIKKGVSAAGARDVGMLLTKCSAGIISDRVISVDTGAGISLTDCDNIVINNIVDIVNGINVQPVISFSGVCSKITIGNVNHTRPDIAGKKAIYGGADNVTDMTCRFPRNARLSFNSGALTIFDPWDLIDSVNQTATNIVVNYKSHVTQDAADTAQYTSRSVTATSVFKTNTAGKTGTVFLTDAALATKDMTTYSGTIEVNLVC